MNISLVVAASVNNAIGKDNQLLWSLPNDLKHFKNLTWGLPIVMGRKTFDSIGRPLPGRKNIVMTHQKGMSLQGVLVVNTINDVKMLAKEMDVKEVMVIGGGKIYELFFPIATTIYFTRVHTTIEGDTFFSPIDEKKWERTSIVKNKADDRHAYDYDFETWVLRK